MEATERPFHRFADVTRHKRNGNNRREGLNNRRANPRRFIRVRRKPIQPPPNPPPPPPPLLPNTSSSSIQGRIIIIVIEPSTRYELFIPLLSSPIPPLLFYDMIFFSFFALLFFLFLKNEYRSCWDIFCRSTIVDDSFLWMRLLTY